MKWIVPILALLLVGCQDKTTRKQKFFTKANTLAAEKDYREAIRYYDKVLSIDTAYSLAFTNRGIAYFKLGRYEKALADYDRVLFLEPDNFNAYLNRVNALLELERYDAGMLSLQNAIGLFPDSARLYFQKGLLFSAQGRYNEAEEAFTEAIQRDPQNAESYINRATIYYLTGKQEDAVSDLQKPLADGRPESYNLLSMICLKKDKKSEALLWINKALEKEPYNPYFLNNRGWVYLQMGNMPGAAKDIEQSLKLDPHNAWAYRNRGALALEQGMAEEAIDLLEKSLAMDEKVESVYYYLGMAYFHHDKKDQACRVWAKGAEKGDARADGQLAEHCGK